MSIDPYDGNLATARIDGEEPAPVRGENQGALRTQAATTALTTNGGRTGRGQRAIGGTVEGRDRVRAGGVIENIDVASNETVTGSQSTR